MNSRILVCLLVSALLTACAGSPMQQNLAALERAKQAIAAAAADNQVQRYTAADLQRAQDTLQAAQTAWTQKQDRALAEHLAYMAQRHAEIAQAMAAEQAAVAQSELTRSQGVEVLKEQLSELKPRQTEQGIVLTLSNVLFAFDSAQLQPIAQAPLDKLAAYLRDHPQTQVRIVGYTDSTGSISYNQRLSERRAQSVADAMVQRGVDRTRMEVSGQGESNPVASNATAQGQQLNRRVEFIILNQSNQSSQSSQPSHSQPNQLSQP